MLAWRRKNSLSPFKFDRPLTFSATAFSDSHFPQCRREPTSYILQCVVTNPRPEISGFLQKGFSEITKEIMGKAMHGVCLKGWARFCVFYTNTLINMYSKLGNIWYAQRVFDRMPERNEASWGNMITGYVNAGLHFDAFRVFIQMRNQGFELNGYNIPSLLTAVSKSGSMFSEGLQIHSLVLKNGLMYDVFVGTSLLHFYGGYGLISDACMLFEALPDRNVVSWTSLMDNFRDVGLFNEVVNLYQRMRVECNFCDRKTFATVISSCGALGDEFLVLQVLGHVVKSALEKDASVANYLVSAFGGFGRLDIAIHIFDNIGKCNTMLWNSMLAAFAHNLLFEESLGYFRLMRLNHGEVDENTLSTVLSIGNFVDNMEWGREIHGLVLKMGFEFDIRLSNSLLTVYFKTGRSDDAENLFDNLPKKDLVSWNSMMAGYVLEGNCFNALRMFRKLLRAGNTANYVTFATALSSCGDAELMDEGKSVHALVITSGLNENTVVGNALVSMYGKCGMMHEAKKVFQYMPIKELVTWNTLIGGYAESNEVDEAIRTFNTMRKMNVNPDYITLLHVLESCHNPSYLLIHGRPLHAYILLTGFGSDEYVTNSLISMYAKCGDPESSNSIFHSSVARTSAAWNAMAAAKAHNGQWEEAVELLRDMHRAGVTFDQFSLSTALSLSANLAILQDGQHFHGLAIKLGLDRQHFIANATMDVYGKCGELNDLLQLLPDPKMRSRLSWNLLISALARHGYFHEAKEAFNKMAAYGAEPDHITFVALLSACSHGGLVDDGLAYFAAMTTEYRVPVAAKHCACIVDLLGRAGRLAEAEAFVEGMPVPPNDNVWQTLLAACEIHGDTKLGKKAAEHLLEANPSNDSAYVLCSNTYATAGRWQDVQGLRFRMRTGNVVKKQACSWLNMRNNIGAFVAGGSDRCCSSS